MNTCFDCVCVCFCLCLCEHTCIHVCVSTQSSLFTGPGYRCVNWYMEAGAGDEMHIGRDGRREGAVPSLAPSPPSSLCERAEEKWERDLKMHNQWHLYQLIVLSLTTPLNITSTHGCMHANTHEHDSTHTRTCAQTHTHIIISGFCMPEISIPIMTNSLNSHILLGTPPSLRK